MRARDLQRHLRRVLALSKSPYTTMQDVQVELAKLIDGARPPVVVIEEVRDEGE